MNFNFIAMNTSTYNRKRKILLAILILFFGLNSSYAQFKMGNTLTPLAGSSYPIVLSNDVLGGLHQVETITDRNAITALRRKQGMLCAVTATGKTYQLIAGIENSNWVEFGGGASSSALSSLTAAAATATLDNTNWAQTWNWNTATTQSAFTINANTLTSGTALRIASTGSGILTSGSLLNVSGQVAAGTETNGLFSVDNTGVSTTGTVATIQANSTAGSGLTVLANGNVGIGTSVPASMLEVNGAATNKVAYDAAAGTTIDFSISNIAYTSATGAAIALSNLKNGGAYTLIFTSTTVADAVAFSGPVSFVYMGTAARTVGKIHIYSFIVAGTVAYVTMATSN